MSSTPKITVFSTTHCPSCQTLKRWLDQRGIAYEAVNVEEEPARQAELIEKSGSFLVPVTIISLADGREEIIQGTQYGRIKSILGLSEAS